MNHTRTAILAVQESHLTDDLALNITTAFNTKLALFYSPLPDNRNAAGVAIVINKALLNTDNTTFEEIIPGRAILVSILWHADVRIKILNVYAPNNPTNNEKFWMLNRNCGNAHQ